MPDDDFLNEPDSKNTGEMLDHSPLKFGKFKGKTPSAIAELGKVGESYLTWAYETVGNFDVCSEALYKDCGGRGKRAVGNRNSLPDRGAYTPPVDTYESRDHARAPKRDKQLGYFDDMDDDIPF